tara:strand:+ start:166 stop:552 length:387 start_codon:yes stop_codon:yes gene_type:complete
MGVYLYLGAKTPPVINMSDEKVAKKTMNETLRMRIRDVNNLVTNLMQFVDTLMTKNEWVAVLGLLVANKALYDAVAHRFGAKVDIAQKIDELIESVTLLTMSKAAIKAKAKAELNEQIKALKDALKEL